MPPSVALQDIALTDTLPKDVSWADLRDQIKQSISENMDAFQDLPPPNPPPIFVPSPVKFLPFPSRSAAPHMQKTPPTRLSSKELDEWKDSLFHLLDDLDAPPFTIQRICELCVFPRSHYESTGKYVRAFERSLLVTGSWEEYKQLGEAAGIATSDPHNLLNRTPLQHPPPPPSTAPSTPLFSPIPFLHRDARTSRSPSPPPSPLALSAIGTNGGHLPTMSLAEGGAGHPLGLVDEMDDPGPGHLSDHPIALTSVTTVPTTVAGPSTSSTATSSSMAVGNSFQPESSSLDERFTRGNDDGENAAMETMDENKENRK